MKAMPVIEKNIFAVSKEKIWNAITDKNEMKRWYFELEEFIPEVGFEFRFWGGTLIADWKHFPPTTRIWQAQILKPAGNI